MRERGEVATAANRTVTRHQRRDSFVQHSDQRLREERPDARHAHRESACAQEHRCAHDLHVYRSSDSRGVGADQGQLQLGLAERSNPSAGERAKPSRHAVDRFSGRGRPLDAGAAALHLGARRGGKGDLFAMTGHGHDLVFCQPSAAQRDRHVRLRLADVLERFEVAPT